MVVLITLFRAHAADLLTHHKVFLCNFRIALYKSGGLQTNVGAIPVEFNTTRQQGNVLFVQTSRLARLASECALDKFLKQFLVGNLSILG